VKRVRQFSEEQKAKRLKTTLAWQKAHRGELKVLLENDEIHKGAVLTNG
jgi:hypothetical protein